MSSNSPATDVQPSSASLPAGQSQSAYGWYALTVFTLVYVLNFIDRQIMSILAEDIKADLGATDAQMGFLYGTVFAVFYALFGIPLGRLADMWHRVRLLSLGLGFWSGMTAFSGFAQNFGQLALARIGVGVGEASASPTVYSLLSDYFPKERRATALSIYSSGIYIGGGLSLFIGGLTVQKWNAAFPDGGPLGLVGWQAAFLVAGIPGLLVALWVASLKEPVRGQSEGLPTAEEPRPWPKFLHELMAVLPPFTLVMAARRGVSSLAVNALAMVFAGLFVVGMTSLSGNWSQWMALGLGAYAVASWAQALYHRDRPTWQLIWGTPVFVLIVVTFGVVSGINYSLGFWQAPYAIRELGADKAMAGLFLGSGGALGGFLSINIGGRLADFLRQRHPSGRIVVGFLTVLMPLPFLLLQFNTTSLAIYYLSAFLVAFFGSQYVGVIGATLQDLVLPRMRGAATATYFLGTTIIGLGLGPFGVGFISDLTGSLRTGILSLAGIAPFAVAAMILIFKILPGAEASRIDRARLAGEEVMIA